MLKSVLLAGFLVSSVGAGSQTAPVQHASVNPRANELSDREPLLKSWALRLHDRNHDGWLTSFEAAAAAESFREVADADRDGRVSLREYDAALEFIRARY